MDLDSRLNLLGIDRGDKSAGTGAWLPIAALDRVREMSVRGHEERYERSNDSMARVIVYLSPYLFWAALGAIAGVIYLLQG